MRNADGKGRMEGRGETDRFLPFLPFFLSPLPKSEFRCPYYFQIYDKKGELRIKMYVPSKIFLTKGVGRHKDTLTSFEMALRDAKIASFNLVKVSSIYPPGCKMISLSRGLQQLQPGQIVHCVMSENSTNEPNRLIAASVGLAVPADKKQYGYLSEHHSFGETDKETGDYAEDIAASMLATILGIDFDINQSYDEKEQIWRMSGKIVKTTNISQSAIGGKDRLWTTVVAAAILLE